MGSKLKGSQRTLNASSATTRSAGSYTRFVATPHLDHMTGAPLRNKKPARKTHFPRANKIKMLKI